MVQFQHGEAECTCIETAPVQLMAAAFVDWLKFVSCQNMFSRRGIAFPGSLPMRRIQINRHIDGTAQMYDQKGGTQLSITKGASQLGSLLAEILVHASNNIKMLFLTL